MFDYVYIDGESTNAINNDCDNDNNNDDNNRSQERNIDDSNECVDDKHEQYKHVQHSS